MSKVLDELAASPDGLERDLARALRAFQTPKRVGETPAGSVMSRVISGNRVLRPSSRAGCGSNPADLMMCLQN